MEICGVEVEDKKAASVIPVHADAMVWITVVGNIQLALKHPENMGISSQMARTFAEQVIARLQGDGILSAAVIEKLFPEFKPVRTQ